MKCLNCGKFFNVEIAGEDIFECPVCGRKYIYKYMGNGQYEIFDLIAVSIKEFLEEIK